MVNHLRLFLEHLRKSFLLAPAFSQYKGVAIYGNIDFNHCPIYIYVFVVFAE